MQIFHGTIISCDKNNTIYEYLVENNGKIVFVGNTLPNEFSSHSFIELGERALIPSFADTHIHFSNWAFFVQQFYIEKASSFEDIKNQLIDYTTNSKEKIIIGFGISPNNVKEKRLPTKKELDEWVPNKPVMIVKYDGHASVVNSAMLKLLPEKIKNLRGYHPETGLLNQEAFFLGTDFASNSVSPITLIKNMLNSVDILAQRGIGMIHTVEGVGFPHDLDIDLVRYIARSQKDGFQFRTYFQTMNVQKVLKRKLPRIGGCFATALDGCFGSEDAALLAPYTNDSKNSGILFYTDDEVVKFTTEAHNAGLQIQMHAIGDAAFKQAVFALETAIKANPRKDHRHGIIHVCLPTPELLEKCATLGICIASQPAFLHWDQEPIEYIQKIMGDRYNRLSPHRTMLDLGIHVSGGSDGPCTSPDPIQGIYSVCNHFNSNQSISIQEALKMYTYEAAYMSFDEKERGSLKEEKIADMVILNKNPLILQPERLLELKVETLYLAGKKYIGKQSLFNFLTLAFLSKNRKRKI